MVLLLREVLNIPRIEMERTRDAIQIDAGGASGIVILLTPEAVELRLPAVEWVHPHVPAKSSRLWRRVKTAVLDEEKLTGLLKSALKARQKQFRPCRYCGETYPPEHRHARDVCQSCAERHLGVIH